MDQARANAGFSGERIDLAHEPEFTLGPLKFQPATRQLFANGEAETLEPRVMQVLALLAKRRGEVVSRDALVEGCWDGRAVSEDAINRSIAKVRRIAETRGGYTLETIPRVGYRLTERAGALHSLRQSWLRLGAGALLLVAIVGAILWLTVLRTGPAPAAPTSIAVLPFRNLSPGDNYFAEGLAEEILTQLARQPGLRVAGRTSSWTFRDNPDLRAVGRRLDVAYVLEGSVRRAGERVRVDVALVDVGSGMRRWSQAFEGGLDDIFAIQRQIGQAVTGSLRQEIALSLPTAGRETSGEVHSLYLTARGLLHDREAARAEAAISLLRRAVQLDPGYAPAWANLGVGMGILAWETSDPDETRRRRSQALSHARRALTLAPTSSEVQAAYGALLFQDSVEGARVHLERAVALDPANAEAWNWLSYVHERLGNYPEALHAARRAVSLDPLWWRTFTAAATMAWERGYRREALEHLRGAEDAFGPVFARHWTRAWTQSFEGNISESIAEARLARRAGDSSSNRFPESGIAHGLWRLGYLREARALRPNLFSENEMMLREGRLPNLSLAQISWFDKRQSSVNPERYLLLRALINRGRSQQVAAHYDRAFGTPASLARHPDGHLAFLADAAVFARALLDVGRTTEAREILGTADRAIRSRLNRGEVPRSHPAFAAQIWALQGRHDAAVAALDRAVQAGWRGSASVLPRDHLLADLTLEPAFRGLSEDPRFRRIRDQLNEHIAQERAETDPDAI